MSKHKTGDLVCFSKDVTDDSGWRHQLRMWGQIKAIVYFVDGAEDFKIECFDPEGFYDGGETIIPSNDVLVDITSALQEVVRPHYERAMEARSVLFDESMAIKRLVDEHLQNRP